MGRQILFIGIGQTGCAVADLFCEKMADSDISCRAFAFDTDIDMLAGLRLPQTVPMVDEGTLGATVEALDAETVKNWFPSDWENDRSEFVKQLDMKRGANQWRMKAFLAFVSYLAKEECREKLHAMLDELEGDMEMYVVASLAGGTGAGLFLPITLYLKKYLESRRCRIVSSRAVLAMPDIYETCFSSEQRVKSYANAYAALRELNAAVLATANAPASGEEIFPPIGLRIGEEGTAHGLLFDADGAAFRGKENAPFDRVTLFERVPGIFSAETHMGVIAETIVSFCNTGAESVKKDQNENSSAVYGAVSLTKVRYPIDSIVTYITKKHLHTFAGEEFCRLHMYVKEKMRTWIKQQRAYGGPVPDALSLYCDMYTETVEELVAARGPESLLGRSYAEDKEAPLPVDVTEGVYAEGLYEALRAPFSCAASRELETAFVTGGFADPALEEGKRPEPAKKIFVQNVEKGRILLQKYYKHGLEELKTGEEAFVQALLSESEDGVFSFMENVLKEDGEYLHPAYAMARLCRMYHTFDIMPAGEELPAEDENSKEIPYRLLELETEKKVHTKYAKLGEGRLADCLYAEANAARAVMADYKGNAPDAKVEKAQRRAIKDLESMADGQPQFFLDLRFAYERIKKLFISVRRKKALEVLEKLIKRYQVLLDGVASSLDDLASDVKLYVLAESGEGGNICYVGSSVAEKEALYDAYMEAYTEDLSLRAADDAALGKLVSEAARTEGNEENRRAEREAFLRGMEDIFASRLRASDFYKKNIDKNIIQVLVHTDAEGNAAVQGRAFVGRNIPLTMGQPANSKDRRAIRTAVTAILSDKIGAFIADSGLPKEGQTPAAYVEAVMYSAGEYRGKAAFSSRIGEREMYVRKEVSDLPLYMVDSLSEKGAGCTGFASYNKARRHAYEQNTPMWDPSLTYHRGAIVPLPYIHPEVQHAYVTSVAKAVVIGFVQNVVFPSAYESVGEVYCTKEGTERVPLFIGEDVIAAGDLHGLFLWAYIHAEWTEKYAAKFDRAVKDSRRVLPAMSMSMLNYAHILEMVRTDETLGALADAFAALLAYFFREDVPAENGCASALAAMMNETVYAYCFGNAEDAVNEMSAGVYDQLVSVFVDRLSVTCGAQTAEKIIEWLNDRGEFLKCAFPNGFDRWNAPAEADPEV